MQTQFETIQALYAPQGGVCWLRDKDANIHTYTELPVDGYVGNITDFANLVTVHDDWNASAAEKRPSASAEVREDMAYMASQGLDWWGSISQSGFGPTAPVDWRSGRPFGADATMVITTVPPVDTDELREAAELPTSASHGGRISQASTYTDWLSAARITTPDDDDAFTAEGSLQWESLDEYDADDSTANMQAWWV